MIYLFCSIHLSLLLQEGEQTEAKHKHKTMTSGCDADQLYIHLVKINYYSCKKMYCTSGYMKTHGEEMTLR